MHGSLTAAFPWHSMIALPSLETMADIGKSAESPSRNDDTLNLFRMAFSPCEGEK